MISQTYCCLRLRWMVVLLTCLVWATMGNAASLVERGDFGPSTFAAKGGAEGLPSMKGMGATERGKVLTEGGFNQTKVSNSAAKNETWAHPDGSEVRVHPYGNVKQTPYKSGNNAHMHKQDGAGNQLDDAGGINTNPNDTHIGLPNPADFPAVRGRPHGS
jgi:hypothetical protein